MDKLKLLLWIALIGAVGYSVKSCQRAMNEWNRFEQDTTRLFTQLEVDRIAKDSSDAANARSQAVVDSALKVANQRAVTRTRLEREGDSLEALLSQSATTGDSLFIALQAAQKWRGALGEAQGEIASLRVIVAQQALSLTRLEVSEAFGWKNADSLAALIRRTPKCPRLPLVNIPVPRLGVGFAVTSGGSGVGVALTMPLGGCR